MKKETQASKSEGVLDLRQHPIDPEHYHTVAKATAEALADEIVRRHHASRTDEYPLPIHSIIAQTLFEWFTGKFTPGGPTDPQPGAPAQKEQTGGPPPSE